MTVQLPVQSSVEPSFYPQNLPTAGVYSQSVPILPQPQAPLVGFQSL